MRRLIFLLIMSYSAIAGAAQIAAPDGLLEPLGQSYAPVPPSLASHTTTYVQTGAISSGATTGSPEEEALIIAKDQCLRLSNASAPDMRFAVGEGQWLNPALQKRFDAAFAQLLARRFQLRAPKNHECKTELIENKTVQRVRTPSFVNGTLAKTHAKLHSSTVSAQTQTIHGEPLTLVYSLRRLESGYWRITGLSIAGQPLEETYRPEYMRLWQRQGAEALVAYIEQQAVQP